jgi:acetyl/propionyl-CoA carboxylase alpha subunit
MPQVPVLPGSSLIEDAGAAVKVAEEIGYPVLLKATGGGGGRGIFICRCASSRLQLGGCSEAGAGGEAARCTASSSTQAALIAQRSKVQPRAHKRRRHSCSRRWQASAGQ